MIISCPICGHDSGVTHGDQMYTEQVCDLCSKPCDHENFVFDRVIYSCSPLCDDQMHDVCVRCGQTTCQIQLENS